MQKKHILEFAFLLPAFAVFLFSSCQTKEKEHISVDNLRCELMVNPEGIDSRNPRLSWEIQSDQRNIKQQAYQVLVASSREKLAENEGDLWNSGKILSDCSIYVSYEGLPLKSRTRCYWKVKIWSEHGESDWSNTGYWSMGLLYFKDWKGRWIGLDHAFPWDDESRFSRLSARYLRKEFSIDKAEIERASVYIIGLGLYELYLNGKKAGDQVLAPSPTDYSKVLKYNTFDVTRLIKPGKNAIAVVLGNGRYYTMRQAYKQYKIKNFGYPKLLFQLEISYKDGTTRVIVSDTTWKITPDGPVRSNNEYDGEIYDARKEMAEWNEPGFTERGWLDARYAEVPQGEYQAQMNPNMKIMESIQPVSVKLIRKGTWILDMGQNMAGWLKMRVIGRKGEQVKLRFAETLREDGEIYTANLRDAKATDIYILKGEGVEIWEPAFVYHGFRFVEITGYPGVPNLDDFEGRVVYDEMKTIGAFTSSNQIINQIYRNAYWGIRSNYKGMPVDCPQRNERQPWLGDRAMGSWGESFMFDNARLYIKWLDDIGQSQKNDGCIPDVAPAFWNYYSDNMTWPGTYIIIAEMLYGQYGDLQPVINHYDSMKKWLAYMKERYMTSYIVTKDSYGDWCVPPESPELIHARDSSRITRKALIATAYYYHLLTIMQRFAGLQNKIVDEKEFRELSLKVKMAFNSMFLNYDNNTVTADLLALAFGLVPDNLKSGVLNSLTEKIKRENNGHISTGGIGTQWLMHGLTENGHADLAFRIAASRDYPGWGYMAENGATTIWELWNGNTANPEMNSHNHVMLLGDLLSWLYEDVAGIKSDNLKTGFRKIIMNPFIVEGLDSVNAFYHSVSGIIKSNWKNRIDGFEWKITIPCNTVAEVHIPAKTENDVSESGTRASGSQGVKFLRMDDNKAIFEVSSGNYSFVSQKSWKEGILKDEFIFESAPFPECHASTIAETGKGLVAAWFGGTQERNPDVGIWISRNTNGVWTKPEEVADGVINDTLRYPCWNPVLYQVPGGDLLLFYKIGPKPSDWKGWMKKSPDEGISWSVAEKLPEGYTGPVKNKPILLQNGRLLCGSSTEGNGWKIHFEMTSDFGSSWKKTKPVDGWKTYDAIQPTLLLYKDGKVQMLCRSKNRSILESWSADNGITWSPLTSTILPNNNSGIDAISLADGRFLLVYNHVRPARGQSKGARTSLNVAVSEDGKTWYATLVLEDSPVSQYSYPSVIQTSDGKVHVVYTWRRERIKHVVIDPALLQPVKIKYGRWPD